MRMWNVPASMMCDQHLLGEHVELHMVEGSILRNRSLRGFIDRGLIQLPGVWARHWELVAEMRARGMQHSSPLRIERVKWERMERSTTRPSIEEDEAVLRERCYACREIQRDWYATIR